MRPNRREVLAGIGSLAATSALAPWIEADGGDTPGGTMFPRKADFEIAPGYTYISGAYTHPMPKAAAEAYLQVVQRRATIGAPPAGARPDPRRGFAQLINAKPTEISYVPNTRREGATGRRADLQVRQARRA